jgi:hypothetical protein
MGWIQNTTKWQTRIPTELSRLQFWLSPKLPHPILPQQSSHRVEPGLMLPTMEYKNGFPPSALIIPYHSVKGSPERGGRNQSRKDKSKLLTSETAGQGLLTALLLSSLPWPQGQRPGAPVFSPPALNGVGCRGTREGSGPSGQASSRAPEDTASSGRNCCLGLAARGRANLEASGPGRGVAAQSLGRVAPLLPLTHVPRSPHLLRRRPWKKPRQPGDVCLAVAATAAELPPRIYLFFSFQF